MNSINDEQRIFEKIESTYDIKELFSLGLYHKYEKVNREYLDKFDKKGIDLFLFLIDYISDLMIKYFSDSLYVAMLYSDNKYEKKLQKKTIDNLKYLNINIPANCIKREYFLPDDELHTKLFFFEEDYKNIKKYLWGLLSRNFMGIEPSLNMEIFFISKDLKTLINVYDDRGMDILELKIK
jgi:hypothetical protein